MNTFTPNYNIIQPQQGGDSGTWGTLLNSGAFAVIDSILGANTTVSVTSTDVTLTTTQFQNGIFIVNGTLTGNHAIVVPFQTNSTTVACGGKFLVVNNGTGNFNLLVKSAAGGTSVIAPQGFAASLYSDGANIGYTDTGSPTSVQATNGSPNGQLAGTAGSVNTNAVLAADYVAGNLYLCTQSGTASSAVWTNIAGLSGFDTAKNLSFTTSVAANALTITALAANTGTTPAPGSAITIPFRDSTLANGDPVIQNVTTSLTLTVPSGATLDSSNGIPFRFWIVGFNNSGTVQLGIINCSVAGNLFALNETGITSAAAISGGSTSPGVFYSSTPVTNKAFRILGFLSYEAGLVTAGTYNNLPTELQLFGPGVKKPGDVVQSVSSAAQTATITPTSAINQIRVSMSHSWFAGGLAECGTLQAVFSRGATQIGSHKASGFANNTGVGVFGSDFVFVGLDSPSSTSAISYSSAVNVTGFGTLVFDAANNLFEEIMS